MRTVYFALLGVALSCALCAAAIAGSDFCEGYKMRFQDGYKQARNTSLNPLPPLCPRQPLKSFGDPKDDFKHGYLLGGRDGAREGSS